MDKTFDQVSTAWYFSFCSGKRNPREKFAARGTRNWLTTGWIADRIVLLNAPGNRSAFDDLTPSIYRELRRIAARHLSGERPNHTLQATALVHEAALKLMAGAEQQFTDQVHFLAVASRIMRQVLVDYARAQASLKRSAGGRNITWTASLEVESDRGVELIELIELDSAIAALAGEDEYLAQLIEMRYFGGMTAEETAEAFGRSVHVIRHDLRYAQAWLRRKLDHRPT